MSASIPSMFSETTEGVSIRRLKYLATLNDEVLPENTDPAQRIEYVEISDVSLIGGIERHTLMEFDEAPSRARRRVKGGDVLVSTVRTYLKAIAAVPEASDRLIASTGFCVVRPGPEIEPRYLGWVAKSDPFVSEVVSRSVGVSYPAIKASEIGTLKVPIPDPNTQERIADFLDERTAQIDGLIAKLSGAHSSPSANNGQAPSSSTTLVGLLNEYRSALITAAVTGQLEVPGG